MGVTIVANSEERRKELQEVVDNLETQHKYSTHAIMHHLGYYENISVSLSFLDGETIMKCKE